MAADDIQGDYLSPEAILAAQDIDTVDVPTPEWGGKVKVRGLTMAEVLGIRRQGLADESAVVVHTLVLAMVQPTLTVEQAQALLGKSGAVCQRILVAVNRMNGMRDDGTPAVVPMQRQFPDGPGIQAGTDAGQVPGPDQG